MLIPKRGGEYWGIGLLKPIWKVLEKVMDCRLEAIVLHYHLVWATLKTDASSAILDL